MFKNIIVPIDGSAPAHRAIALAGQLARDGSGSVIVAHVKFSGASLAGLTDLAKQEGFHDELADDLANIDLVLPIASPAATGVVEVIPTETLDHCGALLIERAKSELNALGVSAVDGRLLDGDPAEALLDLAASERADLIVTGSRGFGDIKSILLGSLSHELVQKSPCPVLVTK